MSGTRMGPPQIAIIQGKVHAPLGLDGAIRKKHVTTIVVPGREHIVRLIHLVTVQNAIAIVVDLERPSPVSRGVDRVGQCIGDKVGCYRYAFQCSAVVEKTAWPGTAPVIKAEHIEIVQAI